MVTNPFELLKAKGEALDRAAEVILAAKGPLIMVCGSQAALASTQSTKSATSCNAPAYPSVPHK